MNPVVRGLVAVSLFPVVLFGCLGMTVDPIDTASDVDLDRFMGKWYVIANIPTYFERDIYNAVEEYERVADNKVATRFTYRTKSVDGPEKIMEPTGFVEEGSGNAVWGMQFIWPVKAEYRIVYVSTEYDLTIIGRSRRDYVWIMSRTPSIDPSEYDQLVKKVADLGYDIGKLRKIPNNWEAQQSGQAGHSRKSGMTRSRLSVNKLSASDVPIKTDCDLDSGNQSV